MALSPGFKKASHLLQIRRFHRLGMGMAWRMAILLAKLAYLFARSLSWLYTSSARPMRMSIRSRAIFFIVFFFARFISSPGTH
jgi:hypothetical protein